MRVKHLGCVIHVICAALMNQILLCQKTSCFNKTKLTPLIPAVSYKFGLTFKYGSCIDTLSTAGLSSDPLMAP